MTGQADDFRSLRLQMVDGQLRGRDIRDERVLGAMSEIPRHHFVPADLVRAAYEDHPLPIGHSQTISQPYIVAYMTQALGVTEGEKILEIGTGSGYQAAVLARLGARVWSIEIIPELTAQARKNFEKAGIQGVVLRTGDGYLGWPEEAPFDGIIVTAAPDHVPQPLVDQLAVGGRMVIPVGDFHQEILILERGPKGVVKQKTIAVRFVPMTGKAQQ